MSNTNLRPRHTMRQIAAIHRCDKLPRLHCCCDKSLALVLSLRYVARIQTSLNSCDRSQRQNKGKRLVAATVQTRRFVAATCRGDVSQRFVASCVSAFIFVSTKLMHFEFYRVVLSFLRVIPLFCIAHPYCA